MFRKTSIREGAVRAAFASALALAALAPAVASAQVA